MARSSRHAAKCVNVEAEPTLELLRRPCGPAVNAGLPQRLAGQGSIAVARGKEGF
jgi:hypothetical protein